MTLKQKKQLETLHRYFDDLSELLKSSRKMSEKTLATIEKTASPEIRAKLRSELKKWDEKQLAADEAMEAIQEILASLVKSFQPQPKKK